MTYLYGYPEGVYHLSYVGTGTVSVDGIGKLISTPTLGADGRYHADVLVQGIGTNYLGLRIQNIDQSDYVHDLRMIIPGYSADTTQVFNNAFLNRIQPFSTLRFMDWLETNGSTVVNWSDRTTPQDFLATGPTGVSYAKILCPWRTNRIRTSGPIFRRGPATTTSRSSPSCCNRLSTRGSRSTSNTATSSGTRAFGNTRATLRLPGPIPRRRSPTPSDAQAKKRLIARCRSTRSSTVVFGATSNRVAVVLAGQAANTYFTDVGLAWIQQNYGANSSQYLAAVALAPYLYLSPGYGRRRPHARPALREHGKLSHHGRRRLDHEPGGRKAPATGSL